LRYFNIQTIEADRVTFVNPSDIQEILDFRIIYHPLKFTRGLNSISAPI